MEITDIKALSYQQNVNRIRNEIKLKEKIQLEKLKEKHTKNGTIDSGLYMSDVINLKLTSISDAIDSELIIYKNLYLENGANIITIKNDTKTLLENKRINFLSAFKHFIENDNSFQNHPKQIILSQFEQKLSRLISTIYSKINNELVEREFQNKKPPLIEIFKINPTRVFAGETANLYWKVKNSITSIVIENVHRNGDNGKYSLEAKSEGQYQVNPKVEDEIIYTLIAENEIGKDTKSVKLFVKHKEIKPKSNILINKKKKNIKKSKIKFFIIHGDLNDCA